jgi:sigma-B regulation protein RsbU (phosphoserine phosphatase)
MKTWREITSGLGFRLSAWTLTAATLVFALMSAATYFMAREALLKNAEENARNVAQALVMRIEARLAPIGRVPQGVAYELEDGELAGDAPIFARQRRVLADNEEIFGMAVAFEPDVKGQLIPAPYTFRSPLGPKTTRLGGPAYRYHYMDWYQIPRELKRMAWSEPYFDEGGGGVLMATCSVPFFVRDSATGPDGKLRRGQDHRVAGVVTADVSLEWLTRLVASVRVLDSGYASLISKNGTYLTHPAQGVAFNETIFSRAEEHGDTALRAIGRDMLRGGARFVPYTSIRSGKPGFVSYAPLPTVGWSLAVFFPRDELLADVQRQALVSGVLGGLGFLLLAVLIGLLARSITRPLTLLAAAAREVAGGNLDARLPAPTGRDEVAELTQSFAHMQTSLQDYIRDLTQATASRERMQSELRIAHDIQMGILPKLFPPLPNRNEIDLFASLSPAREVGGDFYDFFPVGRDQFCFLVGDVSGKGVPAAFYMAVAKTLLKSVAESAGGTGQRRSDERTGDRTAERAPEQAPAPAVLQRRRGPDPGRILARVNDDLAKDNDSCMFVTIFCAVLDMSTGDMRYASAGHNPPLVLRAGSTPEYLPAAGDPVAGALPGVEYETGELTLGAGDAILLYTDGVTEAMNPAQELLGEDRLKELAAGADALNARALCEKLAGDVHAFADGAEQSDDITLLTLRFRGANNTTPENGPAN